jgi:hypothetical protein
MRVDIIRGGEFFYMREESKEGSVDVPDDIWDEYKKHLGALRKWQKYIRALEDQETIQRRTIR